MNTDDVVNPGNEVEVLITADDVEVLIDSDDSSDDIELISHEVAISDEDDDVVMVDVNSGDSSEGQRGASSTPPFRTTVSDACRLGLLDCTPRQEVATDDEADVIAIEDTSED